MPEGLGVAVLVATSYYTGSGLAGMWAGSMSKKFTASLAWLTVGTSRHGWACCNLFKTANGWLLDMAMATGSWTKGLVTDTTVALVKGSLEMAQESAILVVKSSMETVQTGSNMVLSAVTTTTTFPVAGWTKSVMVDVVTGRTVGSMLTNSVKTVKSLVLSTVTTTTTNGWHLLR